MSKWFTIIYQYGYVDDVFAFKLTYRQQNDVSHLNINSKHTCYMSMLFNISVFFMKFIGTNTPW